MEAVGVALGAVALVFPAYEGIVALCRGYKKLKNFDGDFENSYARFNHQLLYFAVQMEGYANRFNSAHQDHLQAAEFESSIQSIFQATKSIVDTVGECFAIIAKYSSALSNDSTDQPPSSITPSLTSSEPPSKSPAVSLFRKAPDSRRVKESVANFFTKRASKAAMTTPSGQTSGSHTQSFGSDSPPPSVVPPPSKQAQLEIQRWAESANVPVARSWHKVQWASFGKESFEAKIEAIGSQNLELKRILKTIDGYNDPRTRIRVSSQEYTLWHDTEELRKEVQLLHQALSAINKPLPDEGLKRIRFIVKVENNLKDLTDMMGKTGWMPDAQHNPLLLSFSSSPATHTLDLAENTFILATPVRATSEHMIGNLPKSMANVDDDVLGATVREYRKDRDSPQNYFHLQSVPLEEFVGGHPASSLAVDARFSPPQRQRLASLIALAFVHFEQINHAESRGLLQNWFLFGHETLSATDTHWPEQVVDSVWVDFGFGVSPSIKSSAAGKQRRTPLSTAKHRLTKIDPAVELGDLKPPV
ncbi:hypothetical protein F5X68DRAFT_245502 [Plectosphaerella plurivora]|uniref:Prion-inhibition and propagation HeLo domain-containing protein n=1 Tax=Plectosphaerella plurivora TaxID=936078 RepID=A0A9P8V5T0_9PEZI|nr:hypothetical protein F5X68DRAFT_245502 [Plectosphaerella plurivora]